MSKKTSTYAKRHPFALVPWEVLNSKAFQKIPPTAGKLLPVFLGKPHLAPQEPGYYRTEFEFSYSEAERLGVSRSTFKIVLRELTNFGFIDPVILGGLRGCRHSASRFRLSDRWKKYDTPMFRDVDVQALEQERIQRQVQFSSPTSAKIGLENRG